MSIDNNQNPEDYEDDNITVEFELEDGTKVNCAIVTILTVHGIDYIALLPMLEEDNPEYGEVWFYEYHEDMNNPNVEPELKYIYDEEIYEAVADAFDEFLDTQEFDELITEEEESDESEVTSEE